MVVMDFDIVPMNLLWILHLSMVQHDSQTDLALEQPWIYRWI